jgi:hypothetical protein
LADGELAINLTDKKLYAKDASNNVFVLADASSGGTTATNLAGGAAGSVPYQTGANATTFLGIGTAAQVLQVNSGATAPEWVNTSGTGNVARTTSPSFTTPSLGAATATSINGLTLTSSTGALTVANGKTLTANSTLTLAGVDGKTLTVNSSLTLTGTDATTMTFPTTSATLARTDAGQTFTGTNVFSSAPQVSTLTNTRVVYAGASGVLQDNANLTFDGTSLTMGGNPTLSAGTANGVLFLNGSKVVTSGSALTFDGTNFGVGTGSPSVPVHVVSGAVAYPLRVQTTAGTTAGVEFQDPTTGTNRPNIASRGISLAFEVNNAEQMRLTSTGLGIGTSSPNALIHTLGADGTTADLARFQQTNQGNLLIQSQQGGQSLGGANGILFSNATGNMGWRTNASSGSAQLLLNTSGLLGVGVTSPTTTVDIYGATNSDLQLSAGGTVKLYAQANTTNAYGAFGTITNHPLVFLTNATEKARFNNGGDFLVGTTTAYGRIVGKGTGAVSPGMVAICDTVSIEAIGVWSQATSGDNLLVNFGTEGTFTSRGSITYNRAGGLVAYNVTSDYRAKDIIGPVVDSGALIDSVPVYMGKMKGATQERPMFIAHETPAYAHTGEKDAVDADSKPVYQQMDASALIPVMWAEIQSLRARLAAANI